MKQARLRPGVGLDFQRGVVLPGNAQPGWKPHDAARAVAAALLAGGFVLYRVPAIARLAAFRVQRQSAELALARRDHPELPVLDDRRDPVAGQIDRRRLLRTRRRRATAAAAPL